MSLFKYKSVEDASYYGDLEEMKKMVEYEYEFNYLATMYAAQEGHLDCLKYAHEKGCELVCLSTNFAVEKGHLHILRYLYENGCECDIMTIADAAKNGHLNCVKYLHEQGCDWDLRTPVFASERGHLDCVEYAYKNGCMSKEYDYIEEIVEISPGVELCVSYTGCPYKVIDIIENLSRFNGNGLPYKIDFDKDPWLRDFLFPYIDSEIFTKDKLLKKLNKNCKKKLYQINAQKEASFLLRDFLSEDIIKYCIHPYF